MVKPVSRPKVSKEENKYREDLFPDVNLIKNKNCLCTSCNNSVKELILKGKANVHPFLETLLCEKCHNFFGDGDFSVDEDGSDKYCRWCGQGGTLYLCSTCTAGFCKKCIKRNLPRSALNQVEDDDWECYCCDVKPLYDLRAYCWAATNYAKTIKIEEGIKGNSRKRKLHSRASPDSNSRSNEDTNSEEEEHKKRRKIHTKSTAEVKHQEEGSSADVEIKKHIKAAANKMATFVGDTVGLLDLVRKKGIQYKSKKVTAKSIKTVDDVLSVAKKVNTMFESAETTIQKMKSNLNEFLENWQKAIADLKDDNLHEGMLENSNDDETKLEINSPERDDQNQSDVEENTRESKDEANTSTEEEKTTPNEDDTKSVSDDKENIEKIEALDDDPDDIQEKIDSNVDKEEDV